MKALQCWSASPRRWRLQGALVAALLALLSACPRVLLPSTGDTLETGQACRRDDACASGHCVDGVCCGSVCADTQACNLPGLAGTCTTRAPGDACGNDGQCNTGHCVDGVCCTSACAGRCLSCVNPASRGTCSLADDNTDRRGECSSTCTACFGGLCSPALPGTDPRQDCGDGLACGLGGGCRPRNGATCTPPGECASDLCVGDRCGVGRLEAVAAGLLVPDAYQSALLALSVRASGDPSVVIRQLNLGLPPGATAEVATANLYYLRRDERGWNGFLLAQPDLCSVDADTWSSRFDTAALLAVGGADVVIYAAAFPQCASVEGRGGLRVVWTGASLAPTRTDWLQDPEHDPAPPGLADEGQHVAAAFDGSELLAVSWGFLARSGGFPQRLWVHHLSTATWDPPVEVAANAYQWGPPVFFGGTLVVFHAPTATSLVATTVDALGTTTASAPLTLPCPLLLNVPLHAVTVQGPGGAHVQVDGTCTTGSGGTPVLVRWTPEAGLQQAKLFSPGDVQPISGSIRLFAPVAVGAVAGLAAFREDGVVALLQAGAEGQWFAEPLAPPILWSEKVNGVRTASVPGVTTVAWSADRVAKVANPDVDGGVLEMPTSSRTFIWQARVASP
jgi:hypothetical protein